jgi:hypothetical protein
VRGRCRDDRDTERCGSEEKRLSYRPEQQAAAELVRRAEERGLSLPGPDGLLTQPTMTLL